MRYFLIAGEASGDLHAANLIRAIRERDTKADFAGLGGDLMREAGCHLYQDYRRMAFMGFVAVLSNLGQVRRNFRLAHEALLHEQPDVLILIDYPSFNLKIAAFCRKHLPKTRIIYYVPPKVWAWKSWRAKQIVALCDEVLCIFPFEPRFYQHKLHLRESHMQHIVYVGNPTMDCIREYQATHNAGDPTAETSPYIALFPGSRPGEVKHCLRKMLAAARQYPQYRICVSKARTISEDFYRTLLLPGETLTEDNYSLMAGARAAIVNSGTATLEAALLGCPEEAVYHIAFPHVAALIWKAVFTIRHFTLVNIIADKRDARGEHVEVIREMIAHLFTVDNVAGELDRLLHDEQHRQTMLAEYDRIRHILGETPAAERAADFILRS